MGEDTLADIFVCHVTFLGRNSILMFPYLSRLGIDKNKFLDVLKIWTGCSIFFFVIFRIFRTVIFKIKYTTPDDRYRTGFAKDIKSETQPNCIHLLSKTVY